MRQFSDSRQKTIKILPNIIAWIRIPGRKKGFLLIDKTTNDNIYDLIILEIWLTGDYNPGLLHMHIRVRMISSVLWIPYY